MVAVILGVQMEAAEVAEMVRNAVEVVAVDGDVVFGQRHGQDLLRGFALPLPTVEPRQRERNDGAVELGENQGAMSVIDLTALRIGGRGAFAG